MITGLLLQLAGTVSHFLLGALPVVPVPGWLSGLAGAIGTVFGFVGSMGVWFPGPLALTVITALLAIWVTGLAIKVARMILSLFTGGGGSAA